MIAAAVALALAATQAAAATPAATPPAGIDAQNAPRLDTAGRLLIDHQPDQALAVVDTALASYDADHAAEKRRLYCGMTMQEGILYAGMAARDKIGAVVLTPGYCTALYIKGFALVDLKRLPEAKATYERLVALAPMHAHFLTELGQLSRQEKDWPAMLATCERAFDAAAIADPAVKVREQGLALRCQGYALVEEHKLDEAEARYHQALKIDPADQKAQGELRYIAEQRAKH